MITKRRQRRKRMQILSQFGPSDASPDHVPLLGQTPFVVRSGTRLLQLNVEGITKAKISTIKHLADTHDAAAILLQETHANDTNRLKITGYDLVAHTNRTTHGTATFVRSSTSWTCMNFCREDDDLSMEWNIVKIDGVSVCHECVQTAKHTSSGKLHTLPGGFSYVCW